MIYATEKTCYIDNRHDEPQVKGNWEIKVNVKNHITITTNHDGDCKTIILPFCAAEFIAKCLNTSC